MRGGWPSPITREGQNVLGMWQGNLIAAACVGAFVIGLILASALFFRHRSDELPRQVRYNLPIEVLYTVVPFVIISVLFYYTAVNENFVNKTTKNPDLTVDIVGFQWNWQFQYPKEKLQITGTPTQPAVLVLPAGERIRFVESSPDVIHSWWVPSFMFKRDVIPGRLNAFELEIKDKAAGHTFIGRCTEFCGEKHSRMNFYVKVVTSNDFNAYLRQLAQNPDAQITESKRGAIPTLPDYDRELGVSGNSEGEGTSK